MSEPPLQQIVARDFVYFCHNACLSSFAGSVDEDSFMTEQDISSYISSSKPTLHQKLDGVVVPSTHLPFDKDDSADQTSTEVESPNTQIEQTASSDRQFQRRPAVFDWNSLVNNKRISAVGLDLEDQPLQFVFDRHRFTVREHSDPETIYSCSSPACQYELNLIPFGALLGIVTDEAWNPNTALTTGQPRTVHYCFNCLEEELKRMFANKMAQRLFPQVVDGAYDNEAVHKSAERLHPTLKTKELKWMYFPAEAPLSPGTGSNTRRGILLRRQKQYEIERILEDVKEKDSRKDEHMRTLQETDLESTGLKIHKRRDISPFRNRYKKQGLGYRRVSNQFGTVKSPARGENANSVSFDMDDDTALRCICGEPPDGDWMIRCSSPWCMFGVVHMRCSGLDNIASVGEQFICKYCETANIANSQDDRSDDIGDESELCSNGGRAQSGYRSIKRHIAPKHNMTDVIEPEGEDRAVVGDTGLVRTYSSGFTAVNSPAPKGM
ncbi:hypothetical protein ABEF95_000663 [Exophiala dermatitidis]